MRRVRSVNKMVPIINPIIPVTYMNTKAKRRGMRIIKYLRNNLGFITIEVGERPVLYIVIAREK
jgi:hypothetical protein